MSFKSIIEEKCEALGHPCSVTFKISQQLKSFNEVVAIFSSRDFVVKEFVDDHMCVLSRDNEGINEAVKIKDNTIQIQAVKSTLVDLCDDLEKYCTEVET